jgi:aminoglycoside phosphotransferase family enzyme
MYMYIKWLPAAVEFNRRLAAALVLDVLKIRRKKNEWLISTKKKEKPTYALDETRPPRLNFLPFNTLAGTIGTDGIGEDVVA